MNKPTLRHLALPLVVVGALLVAVTTSSPASGDSAKAKVYRVHKHDKSAAKDGKTKSQMSVQAVKARKAHDVTAETHVHKGDGSDYTVTLDDATDGAHSVYDYDVETQTTTFTVDGTKITTKFNADGSISVDGVVHKDVKAAAAAFVAKPAIKKLTPEAWAAVDAIRTGAPTAKFGAVAEVGGVILDIFSEAIMNGLLGLVGCSGGTAVWDIKCG